MQEVEEYRVGGGVRGRQRAGQRRGARRGVEMGVVRVCLFGTPQSLSL